MSNVTAIAVSGMVAATKRLEVSASNVANALSSGPLPGSGSGYPGPYVPLRVNDVTSPGGGVITSVSSISPAYVTTYDPTAPYANRQGLVATPNVDLAAEFVQQIIARYSFAANVQVIKTEAKMMNSFFDAIA